MNATSPRLYQWFPSLAHRNYRTFIINQLISVTGTWAQHAALAWYVQIRTRHVGSEYWLGLLAAVSALPIVLFSTMGGVCADRFPKRFVIMAAHAIMMVLAFAFSVMVVGDAVPFWIIFAFAALNGTANAFEIPSRQAFVVDMVGKKDLMNAIALHSSIFNAGRMLGPAVAGITIVSVDYLLMGSGYQHFSTVSRPVGLAVCFFLNGLSFLGVISTLARMKLEPQLHLVVDPNKEPGPATAADQVTESEESASASTGNTQPNPLQEVSKSIWAGFSEILKSPTLRGLIATLAVVLLTGGTYMALLPALAQNVFGLSEFGYSMLLFGNGVGTVIGAVIVSQITSITARRPVIVSGICLLSLGLILVSFTRNIYLAWPAMVLTGCGFLLFLASSNSTVQLAVPDQVRGRVMSVWVLTFGWAQPIGSYVAGQIAHSLGTSATMAIMGVATLFAGVFATHVLFSKKAPIPTEHQYTKAA